MKVAGEVLERREATAYPIDRLPEQLGTLIPQGTTTVNIILRDERPRSVPIGGPIVEPGFHWKRFLIYCFGILMLSIALYVLVQGNVLGIEVKTPPWIQQQQEQAAGIIDVFRLR